MKHTAFALFLPVLLAAEVEHRDTVRQSFAGARSVEVDNIHGFIRVSGAAGSELRLVANRRISAPDQASVDLAKREVRLEMTSNEGAVRLYVDGPFRHQSWHQDYLVQYDFELEVPAGAGLKLRTVNHGDIVVKGVRGSFDVHHVNGPVEMTGLAGAGVVRTVNGAIRLGFAKAPDAPVEARTVNGEIAAAFPKSLNASLRFKTLHGEVYTDFPVTGLRNEPMRGERHGNRWIYRKQWNSAVGVGAGGPAHRFETVNGDIRILEEKQ